MRRITRRTGIQRDSTEHVSPWEKGDAGLKLFPDYKATFLEVIFLLTLLFDGQKRLLNIGSG